jgi:hypothetical protein
MTGFSAVARFLFLQVQEMGKVFFMTALPHILLQVVYESGIGLFIVSSSAVGFCAGVLLFLYHWPLYSKVSSSPIYNPRHIISMMSSFLSFLSFSLI